MPGPGECELGVADSADSASVVAVHRATLMALRPRLTHLDVDVVSDDPWPEDVVWAVEAAEPYCTRERWWRRRPTRAITARLDPREDDAFAVAVALAPYTIGATGRADGVAVYGAHDTGTSLWASLSAQEEDEARQRVRELGGDPGALVPFVAPPRRPRRFVRLRPPPV